MGVSVLGRIFGEIARAAGNVNPIIVEKKNKNLVKDLRSMEPLFPIFLGRRGYSYKKVKVDGVTTEVFKPKKNASGNVVFVCHGGAYVSRMMFYYRLLNKRYSKASYGGTVIHFDYTCAPEATHPTMINQTLKVWDWMLEQGYKAENVIVVGDSAGGNLAMQLLLRLRDAGKTMPRGVVLYSPWIDMTASGDSYVYNYKVDPVFGIRGVTPTPEETKELLYKSELFMWLGDTPRDDPYVSPVLADYDSSFPPLLCFVGGIEMLRSESELLVKKFRDAGVEATLETPDGMFHAFPVYELFPEAQRALKQTFAFMREKFDPQA
ncbi:MAG: alpha/beta hydrolase [Clostridia bacterium]|nr:alpha/beta hydrolase [Clostridia bacterium]